MTVKIATDSVADLPPQVAQELGITVVPLNVRFGDQVYRDGIDLTTERLVPQGAHLPVEENPGNWHPHRPRSPAAGGVRG